jgi:hypothetical protein
MGCLHSHKLLLLFLLAESGTWSPRPSSKSRECLIESKISSTRFHPSTKCEGFAAPFVNALHRTQRALRQPGTVFLCLGTLTALDWS